ncbi:hypothetical protein Clacol_010438 [Clathrus columnatus]|uniref:Peptidase S53 domain-containing protein n=1 Tax=Clathrus columnatus TaxID=1419009 RepID=A0AAV5ARK5_9AGAM|nr:hypothetical protein Clacol_010438 [Clathrus columnatus]
MSGLEAELYAVSDPLSSRYGQHLIKSEVDSFVRPSSEATIMVNSWLSSHGVKTESKSSAGHLLTVQIPVEKANKILNTSFISITHAASNQSIIRAVEYSLPPGLSDHMHSVRPILASLTTQNNRPSSVSLRRKRTVPPETIPRRRDAINDPGQGCDQGITLGCIQKTYNIPSDVTAQGPVGKVAILGLNGDSLYAPDIANYLKVVRPNINLASTQVEMIYDPDMRIVDLSPDTPGITLQVQTLLGINPHTAFEVYLKSDPETNVEFAEAVLNILNSILAKDDLPAVITLSYFRDEDSTDVNFVKTAQSVCDAITQLGTRGVTVLVHSGTSVTHPTFPSTCPHVTSVGSTRSSGTEVADGLGGGFSNIYPRPTYQNNAVAGYLDKIGSTNQGQFNLSNRGFPDVAAYGENLWVVEDGSGMFSGFLLPAPQVFGAVITYLNTQRQSEGRSPLGFINPLVYANPSAFNDITQGDNNSFPVRHGAVRLGCGDWAGITKLRNFIKDSMMFIFIGHLIIHLE